MKKKIILASKSPRRKLLLEQVGLTFDVYVSDFDEESIHIADPVMLVERLSLEKAKTVAKNNRDAIIIASDTIVVFENKIIGKPKNIAHAKDMLRNFSGKMHTVVTGLTVMDTATEKVITTSESTQVFMRQMTEIEIDAYVATGEPMDKAGGYGIQERGGMFIERIEGDYFTVVGLPLPKLITILKDFEISI